MRFAYPDYACYRRDFRRVEYGDERDPAMQAVFERISPLRHAGRITSPLFMAPAWREEVNASELKRGDAGSQSWS